MFENMAELLSAEPVFGIYAVLVTFIAFLIASTLGIGGAIILIPALMIRLPAAQAVAVVVPVVLLNNLFKVWVFRKHIESRIVLITSATTLPVALIAAFFTVNIDAGMIRLFIGLFILLSLFLQYGFQIKMRKNRKMLVGWGVLIGAIGGSTGAAGPPIALAMKSQGLLQEQFIATVACLQVGLQVMRLPGYIATGLLPVDLWWLMLLLSVSALFSVWIARWVLQHMQVQHFRIILDTFLVIVAAWLIW